jgi:hypothetical protein
VEKFRNSLPDVEVQSSKMFHLTNVDNKNIGIYVNEVKHESVVITCEKESFSLIYLKMNYIGFLASTGMEVETVS